MEIIIDQLFKDNFEYYYNKQKDVMILHEINNIFSVYDADIICKAVNIIKTSMLLASTYSEAYDRVVAAIMDKFPTHEDIELFILNITIKIMISMDSESIKDFIKRPKNIYKEVASKYFRVKESKVTEEMIKEVLAASDKFNNNSYSIEAPPVNSWDEYFYNICSQVARNSKCFSRKIGAILVKDKSIVSTGYNGPPRNIPRCDLRWYLDEKFSSKYQGSIQNFKNDLRDKCPRKALGSNSGEDLHLCVATHAEVNAVVNAARLGVNTLGTTMYLTCGIPCHNCMQVIINAGITEIVVAGLAYYDDNTEYLLNNTNIGIRLYNFIK